jgi:hypothetical protein
MKTVLPTLPPAGAWNPASSIHCTIQPLAPQGVEIGELSFRAVEVADTAFPLLSRKWVIRVQLIASQIKHVNLEIEIGRGLQWL